VANDNEKNGLAGEAKDLAQLLQNYAKQETLGPLKGVGRYIAFGVAGSIALCIGITLLILAGLRALQTQTGSALTGNLSWIPYFVMVVAAGAVIGLAVRGILRDPNGGDA
jgi:hypothetical protein